MGFPSQGSGPSVSTSKYTPSMTNFGNVASFDNIFEAFVTRIGNRVKVTGVVNITATAAAPTQTSFRISLPFAIDLAANTDLGGLMAMQGAAGPVDAGGYIIGDAANDEAWAFFVSYSLGITTVGYSFEYDIP